MARELKRVFLQLAYPLDYKKHIINSGFMSEKMDGMRAFWDGGISRGLLASQVPWANTTKDFIRIRPPVATGLWSRYGNIIHASSDFLDCLPPFMLDGELWLGPQRFQDITSICRSLDAGDRWNDVKYMVIDAPLPSIVFADGNLNETNFVKVFNGIPQWLNDRGFINPIPMTAHSSFERTCNWLMKNLEGNQHVELTAQEKLPVHTDKARERIEEKLTEVLAKGGEGIVIKRPQMLWTPHRTHDVMKLKPDHDDEGIVKGYIWGKETDKGSKLLGLMGALILDYKGKRLELSGFTDEERMMSVHNPAKHADIADEGFDNPGKEISEDWYNESFPRGSTVTFKYRELTRDGIPKEARFFRKRTDH